jgi:hypothetical protein
MQPPCLKTCHGAPWALIRRGGAIPGKRPFTRMAFLTGTVAPVGLAIAVAGYLTNDKMTRWTKRPSRIEWNDVIHSWSRQPTPAQIRRIKARLEPTSPEAIAAR